MAKDNTTLLLLAGAGLGLYLFIKRGSASQPQPQPTSTSMTIQVLDVHYDQLIPTALDFTVRTDKTGFVKVALDGSLVPSMERIPVTANTNQDMSIPNAGNAQRICVLEVV